MRSAAISTIVGAARFIAAQVAGSIVKVEPRGETGGAQDAQMILLEALVRISDRADDSGAQIAHPADQIDQAIGDRIVNTSRRW